ALVGDAADGYPGLPGWGAKSVATVLARYGHIERVPKRAIDWEVDVRGATRLAATLAERYEDALLFRRLATLVVEAPVAASVDELEWRGPTPGFAAVCDILEDQALVARAAGLAERHVS
ncbi:MAG: 5'-3' exonuclease H3TH domain-containing protein, partial [Gemmatimonadales bacterium]